MRVWLLELFEWILLGGCFVNYVWEEAKYKNAFEQQLSIAQIKPPVQE